MTQLGVGRRFRKRRDEAGHKVSAEAWLVQGDRPRMTLAGALRILSGVERGCVGV
jgi:hypothetical protein